MPKAYHTQQHTPFNLADAEGVKIWKEYSDHLY